MNIYGSFKNYISESNFCIHHIKQHIKDSPELSKFFEVHTAQIVVLKILTDNVEL